MDNERTNKRKSLCYVTTKSGTLESFVLNTACYLYHSGEFEIYFICDEDEQFAAFLPEYIHYIPVRMKRGISLDGISAIVKLCSIFRKQKFDLIQYSTPNASCYVSIAAALAGIPVRLYCQWGIVYVGFSGIKRIIFKMMEKMVCKFSTRIEPDSFGNLKFSIAEGLYNSNKGTVIWNGSASGVDLEKFDISKKQMWRKLVREELGIPTDAFVYGFVGRITGDKGVNELFQAAQTVLTEKIDSYLVLVGNFEKENSVNQALYRWAINHKRVIFYGYSNKVEQLLSAMDTYILPSYREGFGSTVIEAEAMGIPVIVTDIPGPTDAMRANETGLLVKKKDIESLLHAMNRLYSDEKLRMEFSSNAYKFATENFEQKMLFSKILEDRRLLLEAVCG